MSARHNLLAFQPLQLSSDGTNYALTQNYDGVNPSCCAMIPDRFEFETPIKKLSYDEAVNELARLSEILSIAVQKTSGLYLKICDLIRDHGISETDLRFVLSMHFAAPRVSEFVRVAHAPDAVYRRYRAGFFGFKAALAECRGWTVTPTERLRQRRVQRAALRLANLAGQGSLDVSRWHIVLSLRP